MMCTGCGRRWPVCPRPRKNVGYGTHPSARCCCHSAGCLRWTRWPPGTEEGEQSHQAVLEVLDGIPVAEVAERCQGIQAGLAHARKTVQVSVGPDTYQVAAEAGITVTAARTGSRGIRRHKAPDHG